MRYAYIIVLVLQNMCVRNNSSIMASGIVDTYIRYNITYHVIIVIFNILPYYNFLTNI